MSKLRTDLPIQPAAGAGEDGSSKGQRDPARPSRRASGSRLRLGAMPALAVLAALGLLLVAIGNDAAQRGDSKLQALFWLGLVVIYAPIALRLLSASATRAERIGLVLALGGSLFLVKVLRSPVGFVRFDELGWWRATHDFVRSGHAFADNPFVVTTSVFPGLAAVTACLSQLTGLSIFHSGLIVIGAARMTLMLALFLFLERALGSARAAGIGAAVYVCNPSFLYFDAQFGYESLALALGVTYFLAASRWSDREGRSRASDRLGTLGALLVLACMLTLTHHMTTLAVLAFLAIWALATAVTGRARDNAVASWWQGPALPACLLLLTATVWFAFVAGAVTVDELGGVFSRSFHSLEDLVLGSSGSKQLFSGASQSENFFARALAVASVVPLVAAILLGFRKMWRRGDLNPLHLSLAATAALYPITLGFRLTQAGSETSQRASEFVFVGVAFLAAMLIADLGRERRRFATMAAALALTAVGATTFLGGFIIGELQATRQPGAYLVGAEDRSVTAEGLAAADYASHNIPPASRILADRTNATLLGSYGGLDPIFGKYAEIPVPRVLFSPRFDEADRRVVHGQSLAYVVVDTRLSEGLPVIGYYVESDEPGALTRKQPIAISSLRKFATTPGISKVYTNGRISIYDTSELLR